MGLLVNPRGTFVRLQEQPHFVGPWTELVAKQIPLRKVKKKQDKETVFPLTTMQAANQCPQTN